MLIYILYFVAQVLCYGIIYEYFRELRKLTSAALRSITDSWGKIQHNFPQGSLYSSNPQTVFNNSDANSII